MPDTAPHVAAIIFWARTVANSRAGRQQAATEDISKLEDCQRKLKSAGNTYWATQVDVLYKEAVAWKRAAGKPRDDAVAMLVSAADEEDSFEKLPVTPGPIIPAREQLGDLLLQLQRPQSALLAYQAALAGAPGRRGTLVGAERAADSVGDKQIAEKMRARLTN